MHLQRRARARRGARAAVRACRPAASAPPPQRAGDDRAVPGDAEGAVDRQEGDAVGRRGRGVRGQRRAPEQRVDARARAAPRSGPAARACSPARRGRRGRVGGRRLRPAPGGDEIGLGDRDHGAAQAEQRRRCRHARRVCGLIPSLAATTSSTASIPVAPAIMVRTKRSWPGMSIRSIAASARRADGRSRARSRCRAASPPAAGRCRCRSARGPARSCRGRHGRSRRARAVFMPGGPIAAAISGSSSSATASMSSSKRPSAMRPTTAGRCAPQAPGELVGADRPGQASATRPARDALLRQRAAAGEARPSDPCPPPPSSAQRAARPGPAARPRSAPACAAPAARSGGVAMQAQRRLERRERHLVEPHARAAADARRSGSIAARAPDEQPGLRAAQQLVAAEGDQVGAGRAAPRAPSARGRPSAAVSRRRCRDRRPAAARARARARPVRRRRPPR